MVYAYIFLLYFSVRVGSRPVSNPGLILEGINTDPIEYDAECGGYPEEMSESLRPWHINQGLCPAELVDPCQVEVPDTGHGPTYKYVTPFFQGDIVLHWDDRTALSLSYMHERQNKSNKNKTKNGDARSRPNRAVMRDKDTWWPKGKIPYTIDDDFAEDTAKMIRRALRHWEKMTCVEFKTKKETDTDYLRFVYSPGCWSYVGRQGGAQLISMGPACNVFGTIVHEVGHAIGLWHEQSRRDRDSYIKILLQNAAPGTEDNFGKIAKENVTSLGYAYDYESIMHYEANAFSVTGLPTIKIKEIGKRFGFQVGQQRGLSALDAAQVRGMYKCNKKDAAVRKEKCFKSKTNDGRDYRGELDYTEENVTCQHWTSQWPQKHKTFDTENEANNEKKGIGDHNYCRNPSGKKERPWCYTTLKDIRWQFCNVKLCKNKKKKSENNNV